VNDSFVNKTFQNALLFDSAAKEIFLYQHNSNEIYRQWCSALGKGFKNDSATYQSTPFLPISFFKTSKVICEDENYEAVFESSGTTRSSRSRHYIKDLHIYIQSFTKCFELFYGDVKQWCIIGLLPSYLQQNDSSLVKMADVLIKLTQNRDSGFYLDDLDKLNMVLLQLENKKQKTLLIGVTYALLEFAEQFPMQLHYTTVMETGGMKGRRKELTRNEVHDDTSYFRFWMHDRALHVSDTAQSPNIVLLQQ